MLNLSEYGALLIFTILGLGLLAGIFTASYLVRERGTDPLRRTSYECGMEPIGSAWVSPNIRFYVFALIFVIFDVEAAFVFPWAVVFKQLGVVAFVEILVFFAILLVPFAYAWKKGALKWE